MSSPNSATTQELLSYCVVTAQALFYQTPSNQATFGASAVATFPRRAIHDDSGRLEVCHSANIWGVGVGSWIGRNGGTTNQCASSLTITAKPLDAWATQLTDIEGTYCFVIGHTSGKEVRVITDPLGQLHVYALKLAEATVVSTSAILLAHLGGADWDPLGVREFLSLGTVYEDRSLFRGVQKLPPATVISFENGQKKEQITYWSVRSHVEYNESPERSLDAFTTSMFSGVDATLRRFNNPVLDLTGGFDSRILLAGARRTRFDDSVSTVVCGESGNADVIAAERIANHLGLNHSSLSGSPDKADDWWDLAKATLPLVDGECNMPEYANILHIHQRLSRRFGASINGSGGELIRGYWWELLFPRTGARGHFDSAKVALRRFATDPWAETLLDQTHNELLADHFSNIIQRANANLEGRRNTACMDNVYLTLRMQRWQGRMASATNQIWPCLSPMLFRSAIEVALRAPITLRRNGRMARLLLAQVDYELAQLPMAGGYPAIPITMRSLPAFLPLGREYLDRIYKRFARLKGASASNVPQQTPTRFVTLLQQEEVKELLDAANMLTAELYRSAELRSLTQSIVADNASVARSGRVMTLESIARLRRCLPVSSLDSTRSVYGAGAL